MTRVLIVHGPCHLAGPQALWLGSCVTWPESLMGNGSLPWRTLGGSVCDQTMS